MKLELKDLAPYLPHKLKCRNTYFPKAQYELTVNKIQATLDDDTLVPILRPLSDLIKEIELDGVLLTPIYEIGKINDPHMPKAFNVKPHNWSSASMTDIETNQYAIEFIVETTNMGSLVYEFSYWEKLQRFSLRDNTYSKPLGVARQWEMFQKLFEYHFDVFGLIEKGFALNIHDIEE